MTLAMFGKRKNKVNVTSTGKQIKLMCKLPVSPSTQLLAPSVIFSVTYLINAEKAAFRFGGKILRYKMIEVSH